MTPAPAVATGLDAVLLRGQPTPEPDAPHRGQRLLPWLAVAAIPAGVLALVVGLALLAGGALESCGNGSSQFAGPGALGGFAQTGIPQHAVDQVRTGSPYAGSRVTSGRYEATSYGPPWGGIQGAGRTTSGGLPINGGRPRWYMLAVDPALIGHGTLVQVWPNPFGWRGAFLAADTGSAIHGRRLDFYDWRGRGTQHTWGQRDVTVTPADHDLGQLAAAGCAPAADSTAIGQRIGALARAQLGRGPHIDSFTPPTVSYAWCSWFATNIWHQAGVPIPVNGWSGYPYTWAHARHQLFKRIGQPPAGPTPPVGAALMYGSSPQPGGDSQHVNLVDRVLADGTFMVTGGNQGGGRVTRYGPCRLRRSDPARLTGPGCDSRPIYGIASPTAS
jgi:3D (Asp-Asp-Asp) domain-containing protein